MNVVKSLKILAIALLIASAGAMAAPKPAHAFTLFGIHFFEKAKPTPTPTPRPTATPTPTPTAAPSATPTPAGDHGNLPNTGPTEDVGVLLLIVVAGFIARKYWQVSHQI